MKNIKSDYLLVLGCRVRGEKAEPTLEMRIQSAAEYMKAHPETVCVASGGIVHDDQFISEAQVICNGLVSRGVDASRVIIEDKSQTTIENFEYSASLVGNSRVALLTSNFHIKRATILAKRFGLNVVESIGVPSPKDKLVKNTIRDILLLPTVLTVRGRTGHTNGAWPHRPSRRTK